ncbi:hypothetical protein Ocin01_16450 [Orchesella cincta]|uniref:Uncharacterized protein n=1 Tax=Orchesella cincta TaxID=48709 RepID=A0A1D2MBE5_ORCCI|nr:hypothetical protein Ocin01_16450 [Orchesella cincta]
MKGLSATTVFIFPTSFLPILVPPSNRIQAAKLGESLTKNLSSTAAILIIIVVSKLVLKPQSFNIRSWRHSSFVSYTEPS